MQRFNSNIRTGHRVVCHHQYRPCLVHSRKGGGNSKCSQSLPALQAVHVAYTSPRRNRQTDRQRTTKPPPLPLTTSRNSRTPAITIFHYYTQPHPCTLHNIYTATPLHPTLPSAFLPRYPTDQPVMLSEVSNQHSSSRQPCHHITTCPPSLVASPTTSQSVNPQPDHNQPTTNGGDEVEMFSFPPYTLHVIPESAALLQTYHAP